MHSFSQVDVFSPDPWGGNPVAVVHGADDLDDEQMAAFARWTNLSETTFLLTPHDPAADYRLRIFTTEGELPFAGHPTLGSAHAWLEAGGVPAGDDVVQECGVGLVTVRRGEVLAFAAPPLLRSGEVEADVEERVLTALRVDAREVEALHWIDNGPGWVGVLPQTYVARQGTVLGRTGRVHVERRDGEYWVGGATRTSVRGTVAFDD